MNRNFIYHIVELTNAKRRSSGLPELRFNLVLAAAAQKHSADMALEDFFSHKSPNGSKPSDRAQAEGYPSTYVGENIYAGGSTPENAFEGWMNSEGHHSRAAENIAAGRSTPEDTVKGWMNSPGHRKNILTPDYQEIGVGYYFLANDMGDVNYKHYWTQVFGTPK